MVKLCLFLCFIIIEVKGQALKVQGNITEMFVKDGIVPDIIDVAPSQIVTVKYPNGVIVEPGARLTPTSVKDAPLTVTWNTTPNEYYVLMFVDADAPSRANPQLGSWLHWLVLNIVNEDNNTIGQQYDNTTGQQFDNTTGPQLVNTTNGNNATNVSIRNPTGNSTAQYVGNTTAEYIGSIPGNGSGLHRYVFLVYRQPDRIQFEGPVLNNTSGEGRGGFSVASFVKKYNLSTAIAGNYFFAEYDDYVPIIYEQLGISSSATWLGCHPFRSGLIIFMIYVCFLLL